jgi:HAD superfamily hydrolase (TIGR01509 family)
MEHHTLQGAILDLDGTLLDSMAVWSQIDQNLLRHYGITPPDGISDRVKKMTIAESSQYFIDTFGLDTTPDAFSAQVQEMAAQQYQEVLPLKEGALELLYGLDQMGIPYGVATATYPALARAALDRLGILPRLRFLLTEQEVGVGKTQPAIYYEGARRLGLGKRQVLVVEDALHSIETARNAGFFTAGVYDNATSPAEWQQICATATVTVRKLPDLLSQIR